MKAKSGGAMSRSGIIAAIEAKSGLQKKEVKAVMDALGAMVPGALKSAGKFTIPGVAMIKLRKKAATKACTRLMFGEMKKISAKPAKTIVKSFAVKSLKDNF